MIIKKEMTEEDCGFICSTFYELTGQEVLIKILSEEKNYKEELYEREKEKLFILKTEFDILANFLIDKYFSPEEKASVVNNEGKYNFAFNGIKGNFLYLYDQGEPFFDYE